MPSVLSRNRERVSGERVLRGISTPSDIYARPDVYDMEYEGASNHDARFFARLLARVRPRAFVDLDIDATRRTMGEEARLLRYTATTYEPHLQRADVRLLYDRFDQRAMAERLVTDFASHVYFPAELELLFLSAGVRDRASIRRLSVRARRSHVALCGDRGAPAASIETSPVVAQAGDHATCRLTRSANSPS
jgi:hypothetical protein